MDPMEEPLRGFGKLDNALLCTHCGFCLPVCPTYRAENVEIQSPRGRVSTILAFRNGTLTPEEVGAVLSYCMACRACHSACPAGVRVGKLVVMARSLAVVSKPWTTRLFHWITDHEGRSRPVARLVHHYQRSPVRTILRKTLGVMGQAPWHRLDGMIPEFRGAFRQGTSPVPDAAQPIRAALLCGCMARMFYPNVALATSALLTHLGVRLSLLEGFGCCGAPHRDAGNRKKFLKQARKVLDRFRPLEGRIDVVVCDTAACRVTVLSYARALAGDPEYAALAQRFVERVVDFSSLVLRQCRDPASFFVKNISQRVVFMDHCQTRHGSGIMDQPRQLLALAMADCVELPRSDQCCGAGGDTMLSHPEHGGRIRADRIKAIEECGAQMVTGTNSGCLLNMEAGLRSARSSVAVCHLAEILWESHVCHNDGL
ncbi:MAG: (Fe-S)-binding protein [Magnetococcales bacterium]|nr:(Fe-S)-binding protein [Magnetococcales bacterium]MBF0151812.1 (Fe-S)-binding protein [Magnetococcales bacterium]MBF0174579.1 (Fe-S)-binding protein [Magnetococcales bacterium]